jgi:tetratricopeptide (TPR) repeat protein
MILNKSSLRGSARVRSAPWLTGLVLVLGQSAFGQEQGISVEVCGSLTNAYGPYDYTNPADRRDKYPVVENGHFSSEVYMLKRGVKLDDPLGDLDYTLRAFPNHHLALDAMARLHRKYHVEHLADGRYSLSCWFDRAARFKPTDGMIPLIFGTHLYYTGEYAESEEQLLRAVQLMPASPEANYNLGLLYVRLERYDDAQRYATKAYELGYPLPGLRNALVAAGEWTAGN